MAWEVRIPRRVFKVLDWFPRSDRERALQALGVFEIEPWQGDIAKISGNKNLWRKRIGNYRIFYSVDTTRRLVEIKEIERRSSKTY